MNSHAPVLQVAAKALIVNNEGLILLLKEASTGKNNTQVDRWGLVGGRLEPGETFNDALAREVFEETGLKVKAKQPLYVGEWRPVIRDVPHQIVAIFMECTLQSGEVRLSSEHDAHAWINPEDYRNYTLMAPDDVVIERFMR